MHKEDNLGALRVYAHMYPLCFLILALLQWVAQAEWREWASEIHFQEDVHMGLVRHGDTSVETW